MHWIAEGTEEIQKNKNSSYILIITGSLTLDNSNMYQMF